MSSGGWRFIFVKRGFGFAAQSEDHSDQVWAVGVIVGECFEFGDEGLEGGFMDLVWNSMGAIRGRRR